MVAAGMDALSESCENILTRRANQWHYSIIAQQNTDGLAQQPMALPDNGHFGAIAGKKSLPTIEVAPCASAALPGVKAGEDEKLQRCLPG